MKLGDREYTKLVESKLHKLTVMTESETAAEIANIQDGAVSSFANEVEERTVMEVQPIPPKQKRRGRPPGVKNKPKPPKGS